MFTSENAVMTAMGCYRACVSSSAMSMTWILSSFPVVFTASSNVNKQKGQVTANTSAPTLTASLTRLSVERSPGISTPTLPPQHSQQTLLALQRSNSNNLTPGTLSITLRGSSY